jgi:arylformamidase
MTTTIYYNQNPYTADLLKPIDISVSICNKGVTAWNVPNMEISPVVSGDWIGDVNKGSSVNFNNILFNPHAHLLYYYSKYVKEIYSRKRAY